MHKLCSKQHPYLSHLFMHPKITKAASVRALTMGAHLLLACAGFIANGAALDLLVDPNPKLWMRRFPGATTVLPPHPTQLPPSIQHANGTTLDEDVGGSRPLHVGKYPFLPPMTLRLGLIKQVHGIHAWRSAGRLAAQTDGFPADGFPPPHTFENVSWHLSTFMTAEHVVQKMSLAAHTECNRPPFTSLHWQRSAQRQCWHFCNASRAHMIRMPLADQPPDAYPPLICSRKEWMARWKVEPWCSKRRNRFGVA